jgi:hypothetical protein
MKAYKIRSPFGRFSRGGSSVWKEEGGEYCYGWGPTGKTWSSIGGLKAHLQQYTTYRKMPNGYDDYSRKQRAYNYPYSGCVVLEHDFDPSSGGQVKEIPVDTIMDEMIAAYNKKWGK